MFQRLWCKYAAEIIADVTVKKDVTTMFSIGPHLSCNIDSISAQVNHVLTPGSFANEEVVKPSNGNDDFYFQPEPIHAWACTEASVSRTFTTNIAFCFHQSC